MLPANTDDQNNSPPSDSFDSGVPDRREYGSMKNAKRLPVKLTPECESKLGDVTNNKNGFIASILEVLLLSKGGDALRKVSAVLKQTFLETFKSFVIFIAELPIEEIQRSAQESRRSFFPMLLHIVDLGLREYRRTESQFYKNDDQE